ncbi:hypothetical protein HDE77_003348 [Rhodanobacter sp. MP7CTX1]|jgi:hypothetical protein|nr:hypothetical protein [Rhodanobacter sp. MP7CTX1]
MFKPRCPMTPRQRDPLDAQYADLPALRRELATMNVNPQGKRAHGISAKSWSI